MPCQSLSLSRMRSVSLHPSLQWNAVSLQLHALPVSVSLPYAICISASFPSVERSESTIACLASLCLSPVCDRDPVFSPNPMRLTCTLDLTATFDPTMRFKRSNSNLENFHDVFGVAAFSLLLIPWRDIS